MRLPKFILVIIVLLCFAAETFGGEGARATSPPIPPNQFGGWQLSGSVRTSQDPAVADPVNAALLKEYGFTDFASATYTRDDGRTLTVKAARFADASGAYGAFTYYKMPQMLTEKIGDGAASLNERVLFYRGAVLVDAVFSKLSAMSAAELRELAGVLPLPSDSAQKLPGLPIYLPRESYVKNSAKYVVGPVALKKVSAPIPAQLVDFNAGAEVVLGNYNSAGGEATLMLISYPTPQIAAEHLRRIDAARQPNPATESPILAGVGPIFDKRTGPIVAVVFGPLSQSEAQSLLASVNYEADVTWNQNTYATKKDNLANLLVNVIILCAIILGLMLVAGIAFGGVRIVVKRLFPDRVFDRPGETEFISLHLSEGPPEPDVPQVSASIKAVYGRKNGH
ncbi:MAG TPA: DUF6599 family protein [Terriglobales bacterium]|jgi:hypothetical protein|nr:DUF6599 family protein [Terriglobales bacterium]